MIFEAKLRELSVDKCGTNVGPAGIARLADQELQRAGIDTSALAYNSTTRTLLNNPGNIIFEAELRELSVHGCSTSKHCEAGKPVATGGWHQYIGTGI